jgi:hypothetical protein
MPHSLRILGYLNHSWPWAHGRLASVLFLLCPSHMLPLQPTAAPSCWVDILFYSFIASKALCRSIAASAGRVKPPAITKLPSTPALPLTETCAFSLWRLPDEHFQEVEAMEGEGDLKEPLPPYLPPPALVECPWPAYLAEDTPRPNMPPWLVPEHG